MPACDGRPPAVPHDPQDRPDDATGQGEDHDLRGTAGEVHPDVAGPLGCHHRGGDHERNRTCDDDADDDPGALALERGSHVDLWAPGHASLPHAANVAPGATVFVIAAFSLAGRGRTERGPCLQAPSATGRVVGGVG